MQCYCHLRLIRVFLSLLSIKAYFGSSSLRLSPVGSYWSGPFCRVLDEGSYSKSPEIFVVSCSSVIIIQFDLFHICYFIHYELTLRKKYPYSELFWSAFFRIPTEYIEILSVSLCIQSKCGKIGTRTSRNTYTFHAVWVIRIHGFFVDKSHDFHLLSLWAYIFFASNLQWHFRCLVASDLRSKNKGSRFESGYLFVKRVEIASPFPCCAVNPQCPGKKTHSKAPYYVYNESFITIMLFL